MNFSKIKNKALVATAMFMLLFTSSSCVTMHTNIVVSSNEDGLVIRDVETGKIHTMSGYPENGDFERGRYNLFKRDDTVWVYTTSEAYNKHHLTTKDCSVTYNYDKINGREDGKDGEAKQKMIDYFELVQQHPQQQQQQQQQR